MIRVNHDEGGHKTEGPEPGLAALGSDNQLVSLVGSLVAAAHEASVSREGLRLLQ